MSLENEDLRSLDQLVETNNGPQKTCKISYSREFLLSLSELDVCKKLPNGFDQSVLSEFEDATHRSSGSLSLQSFRRGEHGTSPPTRGDLGNYSRGIHGRWDSRSSGRSDRDSDSQSDWDSDSGRRYGNQSRRSWQHPEHDGLLGSGSFPRPSGYAAASAPKVRPNDQYQLNKSSDAYHPPRPYKAMSHSWRETNDSLNEETFGSSEYTSQDRAEEEKRRRASFELMRKEQHQALKEKLKLNSDQHRENSVSDISALLENPNDDKRCVNKGNDVDESVLPSVSRSGSQKAPASRPLVPPGFTNSIIERNTGTKPSTHSLPEEEVGNLQFEDNVLHAKGNHAFNGSLDGQVEKQSAQKIGPSGPQFEATNIPIQLIDKGERILNSSLALEDSHKLICMDNQSSKTSNLLNTSKIPEDGGSVKLYVEEDMGRKSMDEPGQDHPTSILEKLFGTALNVNNDGSPSTFEHHDIKTDETWSPNASKFAHWFLEEEQKPVDDYSSGRSSDLLSLIVGGEKGGSEVPQTKATELVLPDLPLKSSRFMDQLMMTSNFTTATVGISEQLHNCNKPDEIPEVLTCEDLEQSILSGISTSGSTLLPSVPDQTAFDVKIEPPPKAGIDDHASQHLLSLLQKGMSLQGMASSCCLDSPSSEKAHVVEVGNLGTVINNSKEQSVEKVDSLGKTLTLEALFGTAFMKELQGSVGSARIDVSEPHDPSVAEDGHFTPAVDGIGSNRTSPEGSMLASNNRQQTKLGKIEGHWLGFGDPQIEMDSVILQSEVGSKVGGFDAEVEIRLPEEESLISLGDPVNPLKSSFLPALNATKEQLLSSSNTPVDKLAGLNAALKEGPLLVGGQEGPPFLCGPYDLMEPGNLHQNHHPHSSSSQFHHPQMNHGRPLFPPFDTLPAHINHQLKFMPPGSIIHHDAPSLPHHQLPANMLRHPYPHPSSGLSGFDPSSQHPILQQMHMSGNFPQPHLLRGFPRGSTLPPQPNNRGTGFIQDANPMQSFPFGHRDPNFGSLGMPLPAPDVGGNNHPEAFQKLLEMELRLNPKQVNPFAIAGRSQPMYGHELDTSFRYG